MRLKLKPHCSFLLAIALAALSICSGRGDSFDTWTWRIAAWNRRLFAIAYGNGQFVVVGEGGTIVTYNGAQSWEGAPSGTTNGLSGITYGNGQFVAVGDRGTILTSADGLSWWPRQSGTTNSLSAIACGNGLFVATVRWVGDLSGADILMSTDGITWKPGLFGKGSLDFVGVAYGNGRFIAVQEVGAAYLSTDGTHWAQQELPHDDLGNNGIAYGKGQFVVAGGCSICGARPAIATSIDGTSWVVQHAISNSLNSITYGNGQFVAVGGTSLQDNDTWAVVANSYDGVHWSRHQLPIGENLWGVAYGDGHFVAIGDYGAVLESGSIVSLDIRRGHVNKGLKLCLSGPAQAYTIQGSADLVSWQDVTNFVGGDGFPPITVNMAPGHSFYRAKAQ